MTKLKPLAKLKKARGTKSLRQAAREMGITHQSLMYYESGQRHPSYEMMMKISKYYGKSVDELFF